jgi:hypothetical protein
MPAGLRAELTAYHHSLRAGGAGRDGLPCLWLDLETRRCRHYEWRPDVCRLFEVGCGPCLDWREELNVPGGPTSGTTPAQETPARRGTAGRALTDRVLAMPTAVSVERGRLPQRVNDTLFFVCRGFFRYHTGSLVAFGNDGHSEPNTRREVEPFR